MGGGGQGCTQTPKTTRTAVQGRTDCTLGLEDPPNTDTCGSPPRTLPAPAPFWLGSCLRRQVLRTEAPTFQAPTLLSTTHFPAAPPRPQVRCLFPRNENQLRAGQGLAQGHWAGISGRGGLTAEHSASCSPWAKHRLGPPWARAIPGLGPGRRGPGSQECSLSPHPSHVAIPGGTNGAPGRVS